MNESNIFVKSYLSSGVASGGVGLSDEQREEMTNREGVAAGGATTNFKTLFIKTAIHLFSKGLNVFHCFQANCLDIWVNALYQLRQCVAAKLNE